MATFLAAVEAGSLSAAARRLNTPLPTVSRRISELESHLQTKLLNRSNRKLVLTDAGSSYIGACKRILADVTEAERTASGEYSAPTGELALTAPLSLGRTHLIPILAEFFKAYPDIKARLILNDRVLSLVQEEIDVGLRVGTLPDSSLMAIRVGAVRRMMCASPTYLADHGTPHGPEDLKGHHCISVADITSPDEWTFVKDRKIVAVPVTSRLIVSSAEAACEAALTGMGIARTFSYHVHPALKSGTLTTVLQGLEPAPMPVHLVYTAGRLPIKVRAFLDLAVPRLKKALAD